MFGFWRWKAWQPWQGPFPGWQMSPFANQDELDGLKNYRDNLEYYQKQLAKEIASVEKRIQELAK